VAFPVSSGGEMPNFPSLYSVESPYAIHISRSPRTPSSLYGNTWPSSGKKRRYESTPSAGTGWFFAAAMGLRGFPTRSWRLFPMEPAAIGHPRGHHRLRQHLCPQLLRGGA
jgi:hypothetical protein